MAIEKVCIYNNTTIVQDEVSTRTGIKEILFNYH